jgi:spore coat polysaccharide biosynthesis protein SpsF
VKAGIVIQARYTSRRLPGKVLKPLAGKPMLGWLIERMQAVPEAQAVIVATSDDASDAPVADYARSCGAQAFRGPLDDVLRRFTAAADAFALDVAVRVSGDSPLLDPALVSRAIGLCGEGVDLASNVVERTYPQGQSVEAISVPALRRVEREAASPYDREHVTPYFYAHAAAFRIRGFRSPAPAPEVRLGVDTAEDFELIARIAGALGASRRQYGVDELVKLYREKIGEQAGDKRR